MVQLLPGVSAQNAIELVEAASHEAGNVLGRGLSGVDALNAYRDWSSTQARMLSGALTASSMESLVLTRHYWMLQQLDPAAYGPSLNNAVQFGLGDGMRRLDEAAASLKSRRDAWSVLGHQGLVGGTLHAVVLDTNVLLRHAHELETIQWNAGLGVFPHEAIALGVPLAVVEELDGLKSSNASMYIGDEKHVTRTLARRALKLLDGLFPMQWRTNQIRRQGGEGDRFAGDLYAVLMIDDLDHVRLPEVDAEITDRARELTGYAAKVAVASYDNALLFRARNDGLIAFKPEDDNDEN